MTPLFAAIDATGATRFIDELEGDADRRCFCPVCGSPLVARQGAAGEWHFAHETTPQRPECALAPARVLRRLMIDQLRARADTGVLALPPYQHRVAIVRTLINLHEDVQWPARVAGGLQWRAGAAIHEAVATARLDTGAELRVFVAVGDAAPPPVEEGCAAVVFRCRTLPAAALRGRRDTEQHLSQHGELAWHHHPDTLGLVAAAQARLDARSRQIYANWLAMAEAAGGPAALEDPDASRPTPLFYLPGAHHVPETPQRHACAPGHALNVSFTFYRLSDTEAWLLYLLERPGPADWRTSTEKFYALAPYPAPFDGWADSLPESVGEIDRGAGIVRCRSFLSAVTYLSRRARLTRSGHDPRLFADA